MFISRLFRAIKLPESLYKNVMQKSIPISVRFYSSATANATQHPSPSRTPKIDVTGWYIVSILLSSCVIERLVRKRRRLPSHLLQDDDENGHDYPRMVAMAPYRSIDLNAFH